MTSAWRASVLHEAMAKEFLGTAVPVTERGMKVELNGATISSSKPELFKDAFSRE